jgi:antirestriction protein
MSTTAQIFLTDYASYNNGTQFEFGHWVDLTQFSDEDELQEYITNHFAECDEISPLDSPREETMITDFEGFPEEFYSESGCNWEKIFKYIELDWENKSDDEKLSLWNEYCSENSIENELYSFDEEFFEIFFADKPMEAARAASFGDLNWGDDYIYFNGYGKYQQPN